MSYSTLTKDTEKKSFSLRSAFGKAAAIVALAATIAFYGLGFNIGHAYYQQWQDNKAAVTQTWEQPASRTDNLPWLAAGATLAVSLSAGFTGIALGKKNDQYSGYNSGYSSTSSNDGFFWGYMMGSGNRSSGSSSSSSSDNGGAAAAIVIVGAAALAASASVVTYKALKANFGNN